MDKENPFYALVKLFLEFIRELLNANDHQINTKLEIIMAKLEDLQAKLDEQSTAIAEMKARVTEDVTALQTEIQSLKDQLASGGLVTSEQFDALIAKAQATIDAVKAVDPVV